MATDTAADAAAATTAAVASTAADTGCAVPPHDLQSKHLWPEENERGGTTWQSPHAANAIDDCGTAFASFRACTPSVHTGNAATHKLQSF
jgi:hypothetical protein